MALQNLHAEFEGLAAILKKELARKGAEQESNDIEFIFDEMKQGLMGHYFEGSGTGGTAQYIGRKEDALRIVTKYVKEAIDALATAYTNAKQEFIIEEHQPGKYLYVIALKPNSFYKNKQFKGMTNPYGKLRDVSTAVYNGLVESDPEYAALFWGNPSAKLSKKGGPGLNPRKYSMATALNQGHKKGISGQLAHATKDALSTNIQELGELEMDSEDAAFKDFTELRKTVRKYQAKLGKIIMRVDHDRPTFKEQSLKDGKITFETDMISLFAEGQKQNKGKEWEQAAGDTLKAMRKEIQPMIEAFFKKHPIWARHGSKSIKEKVRDSMVTPKLRKLAKKKTIKKFKKQDSALKNIKDYDILDVGIKSQRQSGQPMANTKGKHKPARRGASESATSIAPLMALLNAKLPQTVAKNMGDPGLVNRSGRFASSVRVTDVNQTPQGYPSVGYTYRKNPYLVFEMGAGEAPWASPDRDPRKLIDESIREIAAQMAVGRFYTRRV